MLPSEGVYLSRCSTKLIHVCKKQLFALNCRQRKYSLQICNIHISSVLGVAFAVPFPVLFSEAAVPCGKANLK